MHKLKDKVAIVTGASKGIGAGIARQLAADGAKVVVNYASSKGGAEKVVADIEAAGGTAVAVGADVRKIEETTEALYRKQFDINVLGPLLVAGATAPYLGKGSSIINISSSVTRALPAESAIYSGTKGALDAITGVLSRELGRRGLGDRRDHPGFGRHALNWRQC